MSDGISLLPEDMRRKEEESKKRPSPPSKPDEKLKMYVPRAEQEDIEVIEVDEGDVSEVLEGEPLVARVLFKMQSFAQEIGAKLFDSRAKEPPPKLPPQFFKPPAPRRAATQGLVPTNGAAPVVSPSAPASVPAGAVEAKPKARIVPEATAPRRVRVIRRVRKPVQISFIDHGDVDTRIDVSRRKFTLILVTILFLALLGGSYGLLMWQGDRASANLAQATQRFSETQSMSRERLTNWERYQDLEPRLQALTGLLDRHLSPSRLFDALEANTVPDVSYSAFTLSPDGRLILGTTAGSFESAARQIVAFESSGMAESVQAMGYQATYDADTGAIEAVNFQVALQLNPAVLRATLPLPVANR